LIKNECLNKKSSHIENDRKLVYKKQMKETGLFNDSPYVSTHVAGNVQSTSSTTLYETKLNLEEVVDRDG
jgi:hypothetical protein